MRCLCISSSALILSTHLFQFKYGKISSKHNGSVKKGVIFATYSSLIGESQSGGKYKTRFKQLLHWCGDDFDGVVSFHVKKKWGCCDDKRSVGDKFTILNAIILEDQSDIPRKILFALDQKNKRVALHIH